MKEVAKKDSLEEIIGFNEIDIKMKENIIKNPKLKKDVEVWLEKNVGKGHVHSIKVCNVEYINYQEIDVDCLDEFELKEFLSKVKKNNRNCAHHRMCPLFLNNSITQDEKCILEVIDTQHLTKGLYEELQIDCSDFNDQIIVGQLVSLNIVYNRAMRGLSSGPLVEEIKTISKGGINIDTKVNENFTVIQRVTELMEKLRKSLLLNRDDKLKTKQIKKANDETSAKKRIEDKLKDIDAAIIVDDNSLGEEEFGNIG